MIARIVFWKTCDVFLPHPPTWWSIALPHTHCEHQRLLPHAVSNVNKLSEVWTVVGSSTKVQAGRQTRRCWIWIFFKKRSCWSYRATYVEFHSMLSSVICCSHLLCHQEVRRSKIKLTNHHVMFISWLSSCRNRVHSPKSLHYVLFIILLYMGSFERIFCLQFPFVTLYSSYMRSVLSQYVDEWMLQLTASPWTTEASTRERW